MNTSTDQEFFHWIQLLWDEYKFRHNLYWYSVFLFGGGAIFAYLLPFLQPQRVAELGMASLFFPFIGFLLSIFGGWHIAAQRTRLALIGLKLAEPRDPRFTPEKINMTIQRSWLVETVSCSISETFIYIFLFGLAPLSLIVIAFEIAFLFPELELIIIVFCLVLFLIMASAAFVFIDLRRKKHNNKLHQTLKNAVATENVGE